DPHQGEPDRDAQRDAGDDRPRQAERLRDRDLAPLGRERGHDDRRPRRRDERGPDQDRLALANGPGREVQPAPPDRRGAWSSGPLRRSVHLPAKGRRSVTTPQPRGASVRRRHAVLREAAHGAALVAAAGAVLWVTVLLPSRLKTERIDEQRLALLT